PRFESHLLHVFLDLSLGFRVDLGIRHYSHLRRIDVKLHMRSGRFADGTGGDRRGDGVLVTGDREESGLPDVNGDSAALNVDGDILGGGYRDDGQTNHSKLHSLAPHKNRLSS